jgi:phosphate starvation-inducible protein PhoH and related proteins
MVQSTLALDEPQLVLGLFGARDQHLQMIREAFGVAVTHREGEIRVSGEERGVIHATEVLKQLKDMLTRRGSLLVDEVAEVLQRHQDDWVIPDRSPIDVFNAGRRIVPRSPGQARYVDAVRGNSLTFGIGPAGTGKTYLAVALAVEALKQKRVRKIVLVRPAVEAGESLGFLPGDLQAKINPYLRPLLDALHEMLDYDLVKRLMEQDVIEVIPLAYMRGRTLNEAFIILDEAQNATTSQMKMFLTRMGADSRIVVSGDVTQVDLRADTRSGLVDALERLRGIEGISEVQLTRADIIRHRLVQEIVRAYDEPRPKSGGRNLGR